jgi:hypothetical protein
MAVAVMQAIGKGTGITAMGRLQDIFYASRFMTALAELEGAIVHQDKSDEDAMFDAAKQSKRQGMNPAEAAVSYFVDQAERGLAADPVRWRTMAEQAYRRVQIWLAQKKVGPHYADLLFEFLRDTKPDEA